MKRNLNYIQLYNVLHRVCDENIVKVENFNYSIEPKKNIALSVNAFSCNFAIVPLSFDYVKSTIDSLDDTEIEALDNNILLASLELYLKDDLKLLGEKIDAVIVVEQYLTDFNKNSYTFSFSINVKNIPFTIYLKDNDTLLACINKLALLNKQNNSNENIVEDLPLYLNFNIGYSKITLEELKSLETGDAISLDRFFLISNYINVSTGSLIAKASIKEHTLTLENKFFKGKISMDGTTSKDTTNEVVNLDDISLDVSYVIERSKKTIKDIKELKEGSQIALNNSDLSQVMMVINDQVIAHGRIIDVGEHFAFQITKFSEKNND